MQTRTRSITLAALFAAILAVSAYIRIPIGPVPLTLQTSAALIAGYALGPAAGAAATLIYTAVGLAGLPVFTSGGGPAYILSPTFGYILGFTLCAVITGLIARVNRSGSAITAYILMLAGIAAIYIPGIIWLFMSMHWLSGASPDTGTLLKIGLIIPLPGDLVTAIPAAVISVRLRKILSR